MTIKIALTNLGKYNEGELTYEWLTLPFFDNELDETLEKIGIDGVEYEEYFISDYEAPFKINEYTNIQTLNDLSQDIENLNDDEKMAFLAHMEMYSTQQLQDIKNALNAAMSGDYVIIHDCKNEYDIGYYYIHEVGAYGDLKDSHLQHYINYEKLGRDIMIDGNFVFMDGDICVEFIN